MTATTEPIGTAWYARRFQWDEGDPLRNTILLDGLCARPEYQPYPLPPELTRIVMAGALVDPGNVVYEVARGGVTSGLILLTRIIPRVDALLYFMFVDRDLVGKRKLLQNFIGACFTDFGLNRLSIELPEGARIERFCRRTLGFRYEGEDRPRNAELPKSLTDDWPAKQGSRRQQAHFDGEKWLDVVQLRLLATEWRANHGGVPK